MSILTSVARTKSKPRRGKILPSIREVCLMGGAHSALHEAPGDRVSISGRAYHVVARSPGLGQDQDTPYYVHLALLIEG